MTDKYDDDWFRKHHEDIQLQLANAYPYGLKGFYATVGFIVAGIAPAAILLIALLGRWLTVTPYWFIGCLLLGVIWAVGGWDVGRRAEEEIGHRPHRTSDEDPYDFKP